MKIILILFTFLFNINNCFSCEAIRAQGMAPIAQGEKVFRVKLSLSDNAGKLRARDGKNLNYHDGLSLRISPEVTIGRTETQSLTLKLPFISHELGEDSLVNDDIEVVTTFTLYNKNFPRGLRSVGLILGAELPKASAEIDFDLAYMYQFDPQFFNLNSRHQINGILEYK